MAHKQSLKDGNSHCWLSPKCQASILWAWEKALDRNWDTVCVQLVLAAVIIKVTVMTHSCEAVLSLRQGGCSQEGKKPLTTCTTPQPQQVHEHSPSVHAHHCPRLEMMSQAHSFLKSTMQNRERFIELNEKGSANVHGLCYQGAGLSSPEPKVKSQLWP